MDEQAEPVTVIAPRGNAVETGIALGGFQFTEQGIVGPNGMPLAMPEPIVEAPTAQPKPAPKKAVQPVTLVTPRTVVCDAKERARELRKLLKQAKAWKRELEQLERLIAAADGRPIAVVKPIDSNRRAAG